MMRDTLYRPLASGRGRRIALFMVFLVSGLLHELAISYPAGGGYGLPTLYFLLHGTLMMFGLRGRFWTWTAVLVPLPLLFHPVFHEAIVVPMLELL